LRFILPRAYNKDYDDDDDDDDDDDGGDKYRKCRVKCTCMPIRVLLTTVSFFAEIHRIVVDNTDYISNY